MRSIISGKNIQKKVMADKKQLLRLLYDNDITAILIGGIAMRLYNSPRVTHDLDLAIRTLDIDIVTDLMYEHGYYLVTAVENDSAIVQLSGPEAKEWIRESKSGSASFIGYEQKPGIQGIPLKNIDITTQVDYLFELSIPVMRLKESAREIPMDDFFILVASIEDLLVLKESRKDKSSADYADIQFLKNSLNSE